VRILISENTYQKLRGTYRAREVDRVVVKGKTEPASVFEILDYHTEETFPNLHECLECFKAGLGYYRKQKWEKAGAAFTQAVTHNPGDALAQIYLKRIEQMKLHPPGDDWNGVWVMKTK